MTTKTAHTPGPWSYARRGTIGDWSIHGPLFVSGEEDKEFRVGVAHDIYHEADAAFIVRACNSHAAMLEALKAQHDAIDQLFAMLIDAKPGFLPSQSGQPWEACQAGNRAIEHAEGKE